MAFLEYLGINPRLAVEIFTRILWDNYDVLDGEILYKHIKIHVGESLNIDGDKWQKEFEKGVLSNQVPLPIHYYNLAKLSRRFYCRF